MALALHTAEGSRLKARGKNTHQWNLASSLQPPASSGFTFVELLIAATMISVLIVGLAAHLRGGIIVWQRATQTTETLQRQRVALGRLERELASAIVYDERDAVYGPEEGKLPWPEFGAHELQWFTVVPSTKKLPTVQFITYECKQVGETSGLWRTSQSIGEARAKTPQPTPELVLAGCEALNVRYAYLPSEQSKPLEWHEDWKDAYKELPRLVSAAVVLPSGTLQHVFSIPVGVLRQKSPPP